MRTFHLTGRISEGEHRMREYFLNEKGEKGYFFRDETGTHFDVEKFWDNDIFTVLQRWKEKVGNEEIDVTIDNISARWEEYVNKIGDDAASKIVNHICGETRSTNDRVGKLLRQFIFVEIKGEKLESYLDKVVEAIQKEEDKREEEIKYLEKIPEYVGPPEEHADSGDQGQNDDKAAKAKKHYLMQRLESESPITYKAMCKALGDGFIKFDQDYFDFHCDRGCVGLFFKEGGFTEYKTIRECILIKGESPAKTTLENCAKNTPPKSWKGIKEKYFDTPAK
jgi:hypothetical protein